MRMVFLYCFNPLLVILSHKLHYFRSVQKLDWKLHSVECKALAKVDKNRVKSITPSIRLMVKLYLRRKLQQQKVIIYFYCCTSFKLMALVQTSYFLPLPFIRTMDKLMYNMLKQTNFRERKNTSK